MLERFLMHKLDLQDRLLHIFFIYSEDYLKNIYLLLFIQMTEVKKIVP